MIYTKTFQKLSLHSKIMIVGTICINFVAMLLILLLEFSNPETLAHLSSMDKMWTSYFQAVTTRTAGFNTIEIGNLNESTLLLMMLLMFIGAGSASTASGVKLTTVIVILIAVWSYLRGKKEVVIFERTIDSNVIMRSLAIVTVSIFAVFFIIFLLSISDPNLIMRDVVFEAFSAFGTVGLSTGITSELSSFGKVAISMLMVIGRIGPITLAFTLAKSVDTHLRYPKGEIFTG